MKGCFEGIQLLDSFSQSSCNANHHAFLFFVKNKAKKKIRLRRCKWFLTSSSHLLKRHQQARQTKTGSEGLERTVTRKLRCIGTCGPLPPLLLRELHVPPWFCPQWVAAVLPPTRRADCPTLQRPACLYILPPPDKTMPNLKMHNAPDFCVWQTCMAQCNKTA